MTGLLALIVIVMTFIQNTCSEANSYVDVAIRTKADCSMDGSYKMTGDAWCHNVQDSPVHGFYIDQGSCIKFYYSTDCTGKTYVRRFKDDICYMGREPEANFELRSALIQSISPCDLKQVSFFCPNNAKITNLESGDADQGFIVLCQETSAEPPLQWEHVGNFGDYDTANINRITHCDGKKATGISAVWHKYWRMYEQVTLECSESILEDPKLMSYSTNGYIVNVSETVRQYSPRDTRETIMWRCTKSFPALIGLTVHFDESYVIKHMVIACGTDPQQELS